MSRTKGITVLCLLGAALVFASCATSTEEPAPPADSAAAGEVPAEALERARAAANAMGAVLMSTLLEAMEKGEPAQAVRVCAEVAPALAAEQSTDGLTIRRVSLKVRNSADRPDDYERTVLEGWQVLWSEDRPPRESAERVELDGRPVLRYMRPIAVVRPCLTCHGDPAALQPEMQAALEEHYPGDQAIGYAEGDLRGAFSVTVELSPATP